MASDHSRGIYSEKSRNDGSFLQGYFGFPCLLARRNEGRRDELGRYAGSGREGLDRIYAKCAGKCGPTYARCDESYCCRCVRCSGSGQTAAGRPDKVAFERTAEGGKGWEMAVEFI